MMVTQGINERASLGDLIGDIDEAKEGGMVGFRLGVRLLELLKLLN